MDPDNSTLIILTEKDEESGDAASRLINFCKTEKKFAFFGELGAGKTTLIRAICRELGVAGQITSPSFSIVNEYIPEGGNLIHHIDLFRLKDPEEAFEAGIFEYLHDDEYCFIEWPEIIENEIRDICVKVKLTVLEKGMRKIVIEKQ